jgi:predicted nucleic acid-binding Zn ribbon protein
MSDEPLKVCPKCQGKLGKMLYPTGVIFKGSGFYTTDYKGSGKSESANGSSPSPEAKPETKSDSKPESKPESSD